MLTNVFENFRYVCLETYNFDPVKFLSATGLEWQAIFKKTKKKLDLLTDVN